jgi:hypothetical protein
MAKSRGVLLRKLLDECYLLRMLLDECYLLWMLLDECYCETLVGWPTTATVIENHYKYFRENSYFVILYLSILFALMYLLYTYFRSHAICNFYIQCNNFNKIDNTW